MDSSQCLCRQHPLSQQISYVRNDPVNRVDTDGKFSTSVYLWGQSTYWTNTAFDDWWNASMGVYTMDDYNAYVISQGMAGLPGASGPDPALIAYFDGVQTGTASSG
jgi:hypothetical protein